MTVRWADLPVNDWIALNAQLRRVTTALNADIAAVSGGSGPAPRLVIPFHSDASANVTLTNQAVAIQFLGNSNRNITRVDLTGFTECRLVTRVVTGSVSVNSPRLSAKYHTAFTTTVGTFTDLGTSVVETSLTTAGLVASAWVPLAAGAIGDVFLTVTQIGGDAAADPAVAQVTVQVR